MHTIDLNGAWTLSGRNADALGAARIAAQVPGGAHPALIEAGILPSPGQGGNFDAAQWVGESEWIFERSFTADAALLAHEVVDLELEGVDTFADVFINNRKALSVSNMFRRWRADVKDMLAAGENSLRVEIHPPPPAARDSADAGLRKARYGYGSRHSPRCVTAGICRPVFLRGWSGARICEAGCGQRHEWTRPGVSAAAQILAGGFIEVAGDSFEGFAMDFSVEDPSGAEIFRLDGAALSSESGAFNCEAPVAAPELWWPAGMGAQPLYRVSGMLRDSAGRELDRFSRRVGLRSLGTARDPSGGAARLECNGAPFFAKGAVWIPPGVFPSRIEPELYEDLIVSAVDANFNVLRLWDGGLCESAEFWDLCDERGLMVLGAGEFFSEIDDDDGEAASSLASPAGRACVPDSLLDDVSEADGLALFRGAPSFPSPAVFADSFAGGAIPNLSSRAVEERVAGGGGIAQIAARIASEWPVPLSPESWCVLSQIAAAEELRRRAIEARADARACGFVFEPYADCWPTIDGSSIDFSGAWKASHYAARAAFAESAWTSEPAAKAGAVRVLGVCGADLAADSPPPRSAKIAWQAASLATGEILDEGESEAKPAGAALASGLELTLDFNHLLRHFDAAEIVVWLALPESDAEGTPPRIPCFLVPPKHLRTVDPHIEMDIERVASEDGGADGIGALFRVTLAAENAAFWAWLDTGGREAVFSDNFFHLEPDSPCEIIVALPEETTFAAFRDSLSVRSLWDLQK